MHIYISVVTAFGCHSFEIAANKYVCVSAARPAVLRSPLPHYRASPRFPHSGHHATHHHHTGELIFTGNDLSDLFFCFIIHFCFESAFFSKWNVVQNYEMTSFICNLYYVILYYSSLSTNKQIHHFTINLNFLFSKHMGFQVFTVIIIDSTEQDKLKDKIKSRVSF